MARYCKIEKICEERKQLKKVELADRHFTGFTDTFCKRYGTQKGKSDCVYLRARNEKVNSESGKYVGLLRILDKN